MRTPRPRARLGWLLAAIAIAFLTACQTSTPDTTPGRIAGALSARSTTGQLIAPRTEAPSSTSLPAAAAASPHSVRAGEVIVRFHDDVLTTASSLATLSVDGVRLDVVRDLALPGARLYRAATLDAAATIELARRLAARPDVRYAQPNLNMTTYQRTPDDPLYARQWHYGAIGLPAAWDVTTGLDSTVVAVVDTGILFRTGDAASSHPDLTGRVLPGYDFVSDPIVAGDGTGRDPDPYDEDPDGDAHGTHVAGTIGARSNDGTGVAGVDWSARLVPVRVLGVGGAGSLTDVIDGTLWAAGIGVGGVPSNANPAHVINLSVGGSAPCGGYEQEAFDRIAALSSRNAVVVVAAGNENAPVSGSTPASCGGVITVGATDQLDVRAPYSNYGPRIDVMAPGGDMTRDRDGDGFVDGVLSLGRTGTGFGYTLLQGTSMAAPHVAGVVALMKAIEPGLTYEEARAFLVLTARPMGTSDCGTGGEATDCGAGLIDAAAALLALGGDDPAPTPGDGAVSFSPDPLDFGLDAVELPFTLTNTTDATVPWSVKDYVLLPGNPSDVPYGVVYLVGEEEDVLSGSLAPGASESFILGIDRSWLDAPGAYQIFLVYTVAGVDQGLTVRFGHAGVATTPSGYTTVIAYRDVGGTLEESGGREASTFFSTFDFPVPVGDYRVVAWTDQNDDGRIGPGDFLGTYPTWVRVTPGQHVLGVDIVLDSVLDVDAVLTGAVPWAEPTAVRAALEAAKADAGE